MPELPEVETVRRGLHEQLAGRTFAGLSFLEWPRTIESPAPDELDRRLAGRRVIGVGRRAKFLVLDLEGGEHLVIHLRMTGQLRVLPADAPRDRHERVAFALAGGDELRFTDTRRFGRIALLDDAALAARFRDLGPEPLGDDLTAADFAARLAARRTRLKPLLLDQSFLAGLGNIYVDEALFRAGLHPLTIAADVPPARAAALYAAIREVLTDAIGSGGTTFSTYRDAFGQAGDYYERRRVYGRAGEPCPTCGAQIERIVVGGRGTHYCPICQPAPGAPPAGEIIPLPARRPLRRVAEAGDEYTTEDAEHAETRK
ncbi:MAG TPA: bifunctional DNA-formamidopyrimidine glycosylase/DNA-(apurinic or apyrimidinic site) lyase [Thermomicrobiales bacterium]|nr:bifunctional DNA-formamidopyrimidine glycosylase/DNA-(apurinic or apyrimidinic site) lyase [Thermomicrobiales bacterium]